MKKIINKVALKMLSQTCAICLGLFSVIRFSDFSLCLFGEPEYKEE
ncbi:MAG: hypothetical protein K6G88_10900 [Lachnospiraceae bacterium]|nr:hypothetical protein [Lachnospiraceae bacterium]